MDNYWERAKTKKRGEICFSRLIYACLRVTRTASIAPMTIMTIMIATIPYSTVVLEAKSVCDVVVGEADGAEVVTKLVSAEDGQ